MSPAAAQVVQPVHDDEHVPPRDRGAGRGLDGVEFGAGRGGPCRRQCDAPDPHGRRPGVHHPHRRTEFPGGRRGGTERARQRRRQVHRDDPITVAVGQRLPVGLRQDRRARHPRSSPGRGRTRRWESVDTVARGRVASTSTCSGTCRIDHSLRTRRDLSRDDEVGHHLDGHRPVGGVRLVRTSFGEPLEHQLGHRGVRFEVPVDAVGVAAPGRSLRRTDRGLQIHHRYLVLVGPAGDRLDPWVRASRCDFP